MSAVRKVPTRKEEKLEGELEGGFAEASAIADRALARARAMRAAGVPVVEAALARLN